MVISQYYVVKTITFDNSRIVTSVNINSNDIPKAVM
jgi:hypothetical protein